MQDGQLSQEMPQRVVWLRERLLCWFEQHGRSFPWREPWRSPYELVIAEILLQRTTAAGVARAFPGFIARYPTWEVLARTSLENLQEALRPLGLWRQKAHALLDLSNIVEKKRGELPCSRRDLERLPGVGPYTASAVRATAYGLNAPLVDVNVAGVLNPRAISETMGNNVQHRTNKYLNNRLEQGTLRQLLAFVVHLMRSVSSSCVLSSDRIERG